MTTDDDQSHLRSLIEQWRAASDPRATAKLLQQILSRMDRSGKIWRGSNASRDLYEEALQDNWLWFTQHLVDYDPAKASVIGWFNQYLKWKIADLQKQRDRDAKRQWQPHPKADGTSLTVDDISCEQLSSAMHQPASIAAFEARFKQVKHCVGCHQPQLRQRSMRGRNDVSCDRILTALLERIQRASSSDDLSDIFAQIAADWQLDRDTFRRFCSSSCFKLIRQLCPDQVKE